MVGTHQWRVKMSSVLIDTNGSIDGWVQNHGKPGQWLEPQPIKETALKQSKLTPPNLIQAYHLTSLEDQVINITSTPTRTTKIIETHPLHLSIEPL